MTIERVLHLAAVGMLLAGPILAVLTWLAFAASSPIEMTNLAQRMVLLVDLLFMLCLAAMLMWRVGVAVMARRGRSVGTQLHLRLAGIFAIAALVPTLIVAVFAALTLDVWLESLFSDRIGSVLRNSLSTAEAYEQEHRDTLKSESVAMAADIRREAQRGLTQVGLNTLIEQQAKLRNMHQAYVFNIDKAIIARGEFSYLFNFEPPTDAHLAEAQQSGDVVLISDPDGDEIRALVFLGQLGAYLYVSRFAQGDVLRLLDQTSQTVEFYDNLEATRRNLMFEWAAWYMAVALIVVMTAIMAGFWFAERLAKPVGRLAGAAEKVGAGDLDVRVKEERGADEIAVLSRVFNRMTGQLKGQRDALIDARDDTERRRLFIEAVLSGVTAGVIGLDARGRIDLINEAAEELLGLEVGGSLDQQLGSLAPGLQGLVDDARAAPSGIARGEIRQMVRGEDREFLARVTPKSPEDPDEGLVLTFDDMTALASAQRVAAWGDVARRIAHEIKNPLTPIQLAADRLRRKFSTKLGEDGDNFGQILDVITRQAGDIRRMVDEFSKFARMPEPALAEHDLASLVREAVLLQREARPAIEYREALPPDPAVLSLDRGLIGQVLTNLLQNAADAIDARVERDGAHDAAISIDLDEGNRAWRLTITDNGIGLPQDNRDRLTDPYVTNRAKGTGLGLAIVKKIVEQHGGEVLLGDAEPSADGPAQGLDGARITIRLPKVAGLTNQSSKGAETGAATTGEAA